MRVPVAVALLVLLAGCAQDPAAAPVPSPTTSTAPAAPQATWLDAECPPAPPSELPPGLPQLVVLEGRTNVTRYRWEGRDLVAQASTLAAARLLAVVGDAIVTAEVDGQGWHLVARDADLNVQRRIATAPVTAMATDGSTLFVAAQWDVFAYDAGLARLGSLPLQVPGAGSVTKGVHAIALHAGKAYLLDDGREPFAIFRLDVADPAAMRQDWAATLGGAQVPNLHWLDGSSGTWYVERYTMGDVFLSRSLVAFDADGRERREVVLATDPFGPGAANRTGALVFDASFTLPALAIVSSGQGNVLARLHVVGQAVQRSCPQPVGLHLKLDVQGGYAVTSGRLEVSLHDASNLRPLATGTLAQPPLAIAIYPYPR